MAGYNENSALFHTRIYVYPANAYTRTDMTTPAKPAPPPASKRPHLTEDERRKRTLAPDYDIGDDTLESFFSLEELDFFNAAEREYLVRCLMQVQIDAR